MNNKPTAQTLEAQAKLISEEIKPQLLACETFTRGLNRPPSNADVKERSKIKYIPVSSIEAKLDEMFMGLWKTEKFEWKIVANEIVASIELHVFHPIAKIWLSRVGVGACMIRQKSGSQITDLNAKMKNALEMDAPHAKADALKNAAKSLGKLFGRDLGRNDSDVANYTPLIINSLAEAKIFLQIEDELNLCVTEKDITDLYKLYTPKVKNKKALLSLLEQKQKTIENENS